jgi:hypothetical protein
MRERTFEARNGGPVRPSMTPHFYEASMEPFFFVLGDLDDVRTSMKKAERAAALIYTHFKNEFGSFGKN